MNMNVSLTEELANFVKAKVSAGRYCSSSEVVREALPLLSGSEVPDGNYTLHYNWLDESPERSVRVIGGRLEPVPEG